MSLLFVISPLHRVGRWEQKARSRCARPSTRVAISPRERLLELCQKTGRGVAASLEDKAQAEEVVARLIADKDVDDGEDIARPLDSALFRGKWDLRYSTEDTLVGLMRSGLPPLLSKAEAVYQILEGGMAEATSAVSHGLIENVIEFPRPQGTLRLVVKVDFHAENEGTRCRFVFNATELKFPGKSIRLPFALGRGFFDALYFDRQRRIDRDRSGWLNVSNININLNE
uniref:Plastid lipid-associated protein/fibrillin conserved domain-containing protein n=1 Tax=Rhodosorus marinus TaxID=101924 RepID=A0A7S0BGR5_9RHOD|mmetsp:Transcript_15965/g.23300  ORF Transcript_15965/g.23300 Transcript_15965/m.23300 type:complete len:228 (+) Transcript_15965:60-743(+)